MPPPVDTRAKLLDAALRLYADRGVFNVSLAEVVREAGQRNTSAIHYHFGSREQLLLVLLGPQVERLRARRAELLAHARTADGPKPLVDAFVRPLVELAREGWRSRAWMKIGLEIADHAERAEPAALELLFRAGGGELLDLLADRCPPLPPAVWQLRRTICFSFASRAATARAGELDEHHGRSADGLDDEAFVNNLVQMFLGALAAPAPATSAHRRA